MFADGPSRLPTVPSADGTKCWQMGRPICRRARLQTGRVARWAGTLLLVASVGHLLLAVGSMHILSKFQQHRLTFYNTSNHG